MSTPFSSNWSQSTVPMTPAINLPFPQPTGSFKIIGEIISRAPKQKCQRGAKMRIKLEPNSALHLQQVLQKVCPTIEVVTENFCPAQKGDLIEVMGSPTMARDGLIFLSDPESPILLQMRHNKDAILNVIINCYRDKMFGKDRAERMLKILGTGCANTGEVCDRLNHFAQYYQRFNTFPAGYEFMMTQLTSDNMIGLNEKEIIKFFTMWVSSRVMRQLYMIGLYKGEIKRMVYDEIDPLELNQIAEYAQHNPWRLIGTPDDIVNRIAKNLKLTAPAGVEACRILVQWMYKSMKNDHSTCYPQWRLEKEFAGLKMVDMQPILKQYFDISWVTSNTDHQTYYYLPYPFKVETFLVQFFTNRIKTDLQRRQDPNTPHYVPILLPDEPPPDPEQLQAIELACNNCLTLITGGPGRGKSTIIKQIIHNLKAKEDSYVTCSYTGKATDNLADILEEEDDSYRPLTINRLIARGISLNEDKLDIEEVKKRTEFMFFFFDEASTLISRLMYETIMKRQGNFNIILVGDVHQLPPMSWGAIFEELYYMEGINKIELKTVHRVIKDPRAQAIITNAERIIERQKIPLNMRPPMIWEQNDCFQIRAGSIQDLKQLIVEYKGGGMDPADFQESSECQIICPYNAPLQEINSFIQRIFDGPYQHQIVMDSKGRTFRPGDYVMMNTNNYDIMVMNGSTGVVKRVGDTSITIDFTSRRAKRRKRDKGISKDLDREINFSLTYNHDPDIEDADNLDIFSAKLDPNALLSSGVTVEDIDLAYGISCHKSQGSEYFRTFIFIPHRASNRYFINYRLLYTLLTRAQFAVIIVAENPADLNVAVDTPPARRYQFFQQQIIENLIRDGYCVGRAPTINYNVSNLLLLPTQESPTGPPTNQGCSFLAISDSQCPTGEVATYEADNEDPFA